MQIVLGEDVNMFSNGIDVFIEGAFALGFGGVGLVMLLIYLNAHVRAAASQNWPSVEGQIDSSRVRRMSRSSSGNSSSSYFPEVRYTYSVMGNTYQGNHVGFGVPISGFQSSAKQVVGRYPRGATRTVYYNPQNPAQAVLERKVENDLTAVVVIILCLGVGIGTCVFIANSFYHFM